MEGCGSKTTMTGVYKRRRTESIRDTQRRNSCEDRSRDWSDVSKPRNAKGCQQPPEARRCFYYLSDYSIKAYTLKVCYLKYLLDHRILFKIFIRLPSVYHSPPGTKEEKY